MSRHFSQEIAIGFRFMQGLSSRLGLPMPKLAPKSEWAVMTLKDVRAFMERSQYLIEHDLVCCRDAADLGAVRIALVESMSTYIYKACAEANHKQLRGHDRKEFLRGKSRQYLAVWA